MVMPTLLFLQNTLIHPDNVWALWAVIIAGTGLSIWMEQTFKWAARISGPVIAMVLAMVLSNSRVMPMDAPSYGFIGDYLIPLAIPLLLFRANIVKIARETGWMFVAFHISAVGTVIGAVAATLILHKQIAELPELAGIMTGSYTGGGVNFFAVKESFSTDETLTSPLVVADNFIMAAMFILLLFIAGSRFFLARFKHSHTPDDPAENQDKILAAEHWKPRPIALLDIAFALAFAFVIVALAFGMQSLIRQTVPDGILQTILSNTFVCVTLVSMVFATALHHWMQKIAGPEELGGYMLYVFLFSLGLPADLIEVVQNVPLLFVFCLMIAVTNLAVTLLGGWLLRIDIEELVLCINASLGGPPTAAAMAIAKGWDRLVLPSLLVGIYGYVIGTILGVAVGNMLMAMLGASGPGPV